MEIQALKGHRWFIWALVIMLIAGAGLVTYIQYTSVTDSANDPVANIIHHPAKAQAKTQTKTPTATH